MKKILYLMRHGQTLFNVRRKIQGACDSPLTEVGRNQAKIAKKYLEGINFDHFYSSTAERCSDTLELIVGEDKEYGRLKGLKEMNFGTFEGESEDLNPKGPEGYNTFFVPYGGESIDEVSVRMVDTCIDMMMKDDHNTVLAVSHAGACYHFLRALQDPAEELKKGFGNCSIFKYEFDNGVFTLVDVIRPEF
ncbi:MAG: histidine phosphatase family protein [Clostridium sp.]